MKMWILVANRSEARIFEANGNQKVQFLRKIENPRGRLRAQDIDADRPGVFTGYGSNGGGMSKSQSPTERVAQEWAKKIVDHLELAKSRNDFESLSIIAEASFLGRLRSSMSRDLSRHVRKEVAKDLGAVPTPEVQERVASENII